MNLDKGGAAAVIGTLYNISKLHINRNVIGVIPLAENAIGPESFKPTSVLTAYNVCGRFAGDWCRRRLWK